MRKLLFVLSLLVASSMLLSACGPAGTAEAPAPAEPGAPAAPAGEGSKDPTTFTYVQFGEPETLDPALDYETGGGHIVANVYESLVTYNKNQASEFVPALAESWTVSDDGTVFTFKIREGVKFHNGADLTPSDVAYSLQRGLLQGTTASPQWMFTEPFYGVGVDDIAVVVADEAAKSIAAVVAEGGTLAEPILNVDQAALDESLAGVDTADPEAVLAAVSGIVEAPYDDQAALLAADPAALVAACEKTKAVIVADDAAGTVTMTLAQPWGPFLPTLAQNWGSALDSDWAAENGAWDGSCDTWQNFYGITSENDPLHEVMNGTGPYMLDSWTKGEELTLVRNDSYWRTEPAWEGAPSGPAAIERVVIKYVEEFGTRLAMFQAGDADSIEVGSAADYTQLDPLVGEECLYDAATADATNCTVVGDGPFRVQKDQPRVTHTDAFFNFNITSPTYIGSGKLDGNGIPPDFFNDPHVRKAFNYCFDWDTYISDVLVGEGVQTLVLPVQGMPGYDAEAPHYSYDPAKCEEEFKASTLTSEDGQSLWDVGFRIQATYNLGNTGRQTVAEILGAGVAAVNEKFVIEILGLPWPSFLQAQRAKTLPLFFVGWVEDIHDPHNWYQPYTTGTYGGRQSLPADIKAQFQDILNRGVSEIDPQARHTIYQEANQLFYDVTPGIMLGTALLRTYEQRWVKGTYWNPLMTEFGPMFYQLSKD
ncbi:MAG: ABC transporter substrate-binding protein [Chloroflexota bacterium]